MKKPVHRKGQFHRAVKSVNPVKDAPQPTCWLTGEFCPVCPVGHKGHVATDGRRKWCCKCEWKEKVEA